MPGQRRADQGVDAFSAPKELLARAAAEALRRGMTKTGFYRYCLAKELGYPEEEALEFASHRALEIARARLKNRTKSYGRWPSAASGPGQLNEPVKGPKASQKG